MEDRIKQLKADLANKYEQYNTMELQNWERRAVEMRSQGYPYKDIVYNIKTEFPAHDHEEVYYRQIFQYNGRLRPAIDLLNEILGSESIISAVTELNKTVDVALQTQSVLLGKKYPAGTRLAAAEAILDRALGKAKQPVEVTENKEVADMREKLKELINEDDEKAKDAEPSETIQS